MEKLPQTPSAESIRQRKEALRDEIFQQLVAGRVLGKFHEEMENTDLPEDVIQEITATFDALTEENKKAVLAIPAQLRPGLFKRYAERITSGELSGSEVVFDLLEKARKYGFTLGFHLSPREIKPEKDGSWVVKGNEPDHRHDDLPMAYYSLDYAHRYLRKPVQWLYVVRGETGGGSGHYQDNNGAWGHAPTLSIVDAIDLQELENDMDKQMTQLESKKGDAASSISP